MIPQVIAALALSATAALSQECTNAEPILESFVQENMHITFGDTTGEWALFKVEDGKGKWVMFALKGDTLCIVAGGLFGIHSPLPPNA